MDKCLTIEQTWVTGHNFEQMVGGVNVPLTQRASLDTCVHQISQLKTQCLFFLSKPLEKAQAGVCQLVPMSLTNAIFKFPSSFSVHLCHHHRHQQHHRSAPMFVSVFGYQFET
ncbi:hypothetical protein BLOT_008873 [Blomia tropicalis]|nr:hypothetical protein BLOT_008873 [Blomia tropicalis]